MNTPENAGSRRAFMVGAAAAGLAAALASGLPTAAADTSTDAIKMTCALRRRADLTPEQFHDYWLNHHGPFAAEQIKILGGYRYVQSHILDSPQNALLASTRGTGEPYDGIVEVWFPSEQAMLAGIATPDGIQANQRLADDEKNFIDLARSSYFLTTEHVMLG
ncbi:EthD domain-containing protein [Nocardia sp. NPDC004860]|uniref:EthD domain-containing protein n=1 Tax=Nocardia sp. NPDC004860 TaxID=3154557 RepID=UPI0033ACF719